MIFSIYCNLPKKILILYLVTEARINRSISLTNNLSLINYSIEFTPTESSAGGTLLYIANHLPYKTRNNLKYLQKA